MKRLFYTLIITVLFSPFKTNAQCNVNTSICTSGTAGPFTFSTPGSSVSSCLDFFGPGYSYIILYITQDGPLEMLINGDANSGFLDVAIFKIPPGEDPCTAINSTTNEISCNYASSASGCNQIGTYFSCPSSVPSPNVLAGDKLMIVVENWSGSSSNFTLQLGPVPAAQTGPPSPTINNVTTTLFDNSLDYQMTAVNGGGTWSGTGVTSDGIFSPTTSGSGSFIITYDLGTPPCNSSDTILVVVNSTLAVELDQYNFVCENNSSKIEWTTISENNSSHFSIERRNEQGEFIVLDTINSAGNSTETNHYEYQVGRQNTIEYFRVVEHDKDGTKTEYPVLTSSCKYSTFDIYPNPATDYLNINYQSIESQSSDLHIMDAFGRLIVKKEIFNSLILELDSYAPGLYYVYLNNTIENSIPFIKK